MNNEQTKRLMMGLLVASLLINAICMHGIIKVFEQVEAVKSEISYCIWHNKKYDLRVIKGGQSERHALMDMGRPSDEGDCVNADE